jgi:hypothetical protein
MSYCAEWNVSMDWLADGTGTMFREGGPTRIKSERAVFEAQSPKRKNSSILVCASFRCGSPFT